MPTASEMDQTIKEIRDAAAAINSAYNMGGAPNATPAVKKAANIAVICAVVLANI